VNQSVYLQTLDSIQTPFLHTLQHCSTATDLFVFDELGDHIESSEWLLFPGNPGSRWNARNTHDVGRNTRNSHDVGKNPSILWQDRDVPNLVRQHFCCFLVFCRVSPTYQRIWRILTVRKKLSTGSTVCGTSSVPLFDLSYLCMYPLVTRVNNVY
jgi:hypothetical protein